LAGSTTEFKPLADIGAFEVAFDASRFVRSGLVAEKETEQTHG
jgi:hypothetical protein